MLGRDFDAECSRLGAMPHDHPRLRPYQKEANAAVEKAISERKRILRAIDIQLSNETLQTLDEIFPGPGGAAPAAYAW